MSIKRKVAISFIALGLSIVVLVIISMARLTTPESYRQKIVLNTVRKCIWYGYDGSRALTESDVEKVDILLTESLLLYPPVEKFKLEEFEHLTEKCNLFYNPKGYKYKTWILAFKSDDLETLLSGNLTLWSDKTINRKHGVLKDIEKQDGLKYYIFPPPKIME